MVAKKVLNFKILFNILDKCAKESHFFRFLLNYNHFSFDLIIAIVIFEACKKTT